MLAVLLTVTGATASYYEVFRPRELVASVFAMQLAFWVPMGVFGWFAIDRRVWALWAGFGLSLGGIVFAAFWGFSQSFFRASPLFQFGGVYETQSNRLALATLEVLLFTAQLVAYVVALIAYYQNRHALVWSKHQFHRPRRPR